MTLDIGASPQIFTDKKVERFMLSTMLNSKGDAAVVIERLTVDDFYYNHHCTIYQTVKNTFTLGGELDYMTIRSQFNNNPKVVDLLEEIRTIPKWDVNKEQGCKILKEFSSKRQVVFLCNEALKRLANNKESDDVIQLIQSQSTGILQSRNFLFNQSSVSSTEEWVGEIQEEMDLGERSPDEYDGHPVGMPLLDAKMKGLQDINVISAPTGHGKSMLALNWVVNISLQDTFKDRILYVNYEMNRKQLARRVFSIASGVTYNEIYNRRFLSKQNADRYNEARTKLLERKNLILTNNEPKTLAVTMALIQEHVTCNNVSIVVIDHLGEIASEKDEYAMDHWMKLQKYVKELKNVTTRLGVRLIVIAQQNREGYNNGRGQAGGLGRVAGTLELSRICDCFINMYHTRDGDKIIALEKNRNGEMCKFKIDFDGARQIITIEEEILE